MRSLGIISGSGSGPSDDVPVWVEALRAPSGDLPLIVSDFENGRYWTTALGTCLVTDLWEENLDWAVYNPADILPGIGYSLDINAIAGPAAAAGLLAVLPTDGITVKFNGDLTVDGYLGAEYLQLPDFDPDSGIYISHIDDSADSYIFNVNLTDTGISVTTPAEATAGPKSVAFTMLPGSGQASIDGAAIFGGTFTPTVFPPYINFALYDKGGVMKLVVIYDPQPDADLPTMSA